MKKVLLVTRPLVPPWDEASKNFAYFLGRSVSGHALTLLTTETTLEGLPQSVTQEAIYPDGRFNLGAKLRLFQYLRRVRKDFDITHYLFTPAKQNAMAIRRFAKPQGKTIQTVATLREDLYGEDELKELFFADHLVTYTERSKQKLTALGFQNVTRIYPGIDLEKFKPGNKDPKALTQFGLSPGDFVVMYPGEYTRLGATDMLANTWIDFFTKNPTSNVRFLFACRIKHEADRLKREEVRAKVKAAGLEQKIRFEEDHAHTDMPALYHLSDVVVFPVSDLKGKFDVPLIIVEAYASGKPVILSDLPQFSEFSNPSICVTIPKDSGDALIQSVAQLKDSFEFRERLGQAARAFTERHFDLTQTAAAYARLYDAL